MPAAKEHSKSARKRFARRQRSAKADRKKLKKKLRDESQAQIDASSISRGLPTRKELHEEVKKALTYAEARVQTAAEAVKRGDKVPIQYVRSGEWNIFSRPVVERQERAAGITAEQQLSEMSFSKSSLVKNIDNQAEPHYNITIDLGYEKLLIEDMKIPKFASLVPFTETAEMSINDTSFELKVEFVFLGNGCLKVCLPRWLIHGALLGTIGGKKSIKQEGIVECLAVQNAFESEEKTEREDSS